MPIVLQYANGRERLINGESFKKLDENTPDMGRINFTTHPDGNPIGELKGTAIKSNVCEIIEIPDELWEEQKKKRQEAEAKQKADQEAAQAKAMLDAKQKKDERDKKLAANAAWRKRFVLARLVSKKPYPEVA